MEIRKKDETTILNKAAILFLTGQSSAGAGSENLWIAAAVTMKARGRRVSALVPKAWADSPQAVALAKAGVQVRFFPLARGLWQRFWGRLRGLRFWRGRLPGSGLPGKLRQPLKEADFVVITQGGFFDWLVFRGLKDFLVARRVPYLLNVRSGRSLPGGVIAEDRSTTADFFANAAGIVLPTRANLTDIGVTLGVRVPEPCILHSPIKNLKSGETPWPGGSVVRFACPCRLEVLDKGLDLLIDAVALLKDLPKPFEVSLFGTGPDEAYLRELIAYRGVGDRVTLRGAYRDLDEVWRKNHVLVLPSRSEGMPQTLMEAMVAGRPAVATKVGGVAELLVEGCSGFIAAVPTAEALAGAMRRALEASRQLEAMGREASKTTRQQLRAHPEEEFCDFIEKVVGWGQ